MTNTDLAYQQKRAAEKAKYLALPQTREWKPLTLPKSPFQRPTYEAVGCVIRGEPDGVRLA
jgi:hypothetical protein